MGHLCETGIGLGKLLADGGGLCRGLQASARSWSDKNDRGWRGLPPGIAERGCKRLAEARRDPARCRRLQAILQRIDLMTPADDGVHPNARDRLIEELDRMGERLRAGMPQDPPDA
jgi:hypothetical protein